jgi:hypothetical protein
LGESLGEKRVEFANNSNLSTVLGEEAGEVNLPLRSTGLLYLQAEGRGQRASEHNFTYRQPWPWRRPLQ